MKSSNLSSAKIETIVFVVLAVCFLMAAVYYAGKCCCGRKRRDEFKDRSFNPSNRNFHGHNRGTSSSLTQSLFEVEPAVAVPTNNTTGVTASAAAIWAPTTIAGTVFVVATTAERASHSTTISPGAAARSPDGSLRPSLSGARVVDERMHPAHTDTSISKSIADWDPEATDSHGWQIFRVNDVALKPSAPSFDEYIMRHDDSAETGEWKSTEDMAAWGPRHGARTPVHSQARELDNDGDLVGQFCAFTGATPMVAQQVLSETSLMRTRDPLLHGNQLHLLEHAISLFVDSSTGEMGRSPSPRLSEGLNRSSTSTTNTSDAGSQHATPFGTSAALPRRGRCYECVYASGAPVRQGPELTSDVVTLLVPGEVVEVAEHRHIAQGVVRVRLNDGRGWTSLFTTDGIPVLREMLS